MRRDRWSISALPGPRRLFARISEAVDDGRNVIVVLPHAAVPSGLAQQVRQGICEARCVHVALDGETLHRCGGSIPDAASAAADFLDPLANTGHTNRWQAYLHHEESGGKSVLIAGWDIALADEASYWLRLVHGSSLETADRPTFVFLVRDTDVNVELLAKEHAPDLTVLWWWGVIGRLDSELCADLVLAGQGATPLRRAMLAESVGWELDLADACAEMWGLSDAPSLLAKVVSECTQSQAFSLTGDELHAIENTDVGDSPPNVLRQAWNSEYVNAWEGRVFVSARYRGFADMIDRRFWNAQVRILMPYLERQRQRMAKRLKQVASKRDIAEISGESGLPELGRMLYAHHRRRIDLGQDDETLLALLVAARNKIAHHQSLDDDLYAAVAELLA